jgi:nitrate/nitrite transporter NarK
LHAWTIARKMPVQQPDLILPMTPARLLVLCAGRVLLFAIFMTVAAVIPLLMQEWRLTATAAGAIVSIFTLSYAVSVFGFAWAADHFGARRMVLISAGAAATASTLFAFGAHDWWSATLLYALVGFAQGGVYTPLIMLLSDEVPAARRGNAMGWLIASTSAGYAASLAIAGLGVTLGGWRTASDTAAVSTGRKAVRCSSSARCCPSPTASTQGRRMDGWPTRSCTTGTRACWSAATSAIPGSWSGCGAGCRRSSPPGSR